ncbi:hypothetical protein, partial [Anaerotruncus massiliensis (ex Liu et al. 2021)]|uniref:hypothetical protein n=1 Tax=Anaerotruncus massiliensis (ex Liu et al. 2021) TaxID=2321404 RepID=UPI003AB282A6
PDACAAAHKILDPSGAVSLLLSFAIAKKEDAKGRFPRWEAALLRCSFFSCKKEPKNTPEGLGVPLAAASGAGRGPAAPPPLKRWTKHLDLG